MNQSACESEREMQRCRSATMMGNGCWAAGRLMEQCSLLSASARMQQKSWGEPTVLMCQCRPAKWQPTSFTGFARGKMGGTVWSLVIFYVNIRTPKEEFICLRCPSFWLYVAVSAVNQSLLCQGDFMSRTTCQNGFMCPLCALRCFLGGEVPPQPRPL